MKEEFESDYLYLENGVLNKVKMLSDETRSMVDKKDGTGKYPVYEYQILINDEKRKITLFKGTVSRMYKMYDKESSRDNKSLRGCVFSITQNITDLESGEKEYSMAIKLLSYPGAESVAEKVSP